MGCVTIKGWTYPLVLMASGVRDTLNTGSGRDSCYFRGYYGN